ncbi:hypothetical protein GC105_13555 [Alkalibaculum sp. M08DMB]|uniref:Uncharacterized protein n=1 Tax=Alkalibaculum sporogenes TaxID=2655001 RepID=A0A6A7KB82_9FIRM|nr:metallophosphoesterase [Alkalibaculum sporogenes]MPW26809.1 hypothetical protein [Alkalibaculum sporogenes]
MRIIHMSDLHIDKESWHEYKTFIMNSFIDDLKRYHIETPIDCIIISGDMINMGGKKDGVTNALDFFIENFIFPIAEELNIEFSRFFFGCGNHEVDRNVVKDGIDNYLKMELNCIDSVNKYIVEGYKSKSDFPLKRTQDYYKFMKNYYNNSDFDYIDITPFESTFKIKVDGIQLGISLFNSAWRCYENKANNIVDEKKILLGEMQITRSYTNLEGCDYKIAVMHHPYEYFTDFDYKNSRDLIKKHYDMLLLGHIHDGNEWINSGIDGMIYKSLAPANWVQNIRTCSNRYINGYSIIDCDFLNMSITHYFRKYSKKREEYCPDVDVSNNDEHGILKYSMTSISNKQLMLSTIAELNRLRDVHDDRVKEHLLSCTSNDSLAPKTLEDIFVSPRIIDSKDKANEIETNVSLESIMEEEKNVIIYGHRESGRTVLLDKIMFNYINNGDKYNKLPVYINLDSIDNTITEQVIRSKLKECLHRSNKGINELLEKNQIVLLLDNFDVELKPHQCGIINNFIGKYTDNIKVIMTSTLSSSGQIPYAEFDNYMFIKQSRYLEMLTFKSKQIRELMHKWFNNRSDYVTDDKLQSLLKIFRVFNLPTNPLTLSMFLLIMEKNPCFEPINNATLLESFIERLLESPTDYFRNSFDRYNKKNALRLIAYHMYKEDRDNYNLPYSELLHFIENEIKIWSFKASDILNYFLDIGIFYKYTIVTNSTSLEVVTFRFDCVFKFFLTLHMETDKSFFEKIISEDNYLKFIDELDYYTARNRENINLLNLIVERLKGSYGEYIDRFEKNGNGFDSYFGLTQSFVQTLNDDEMNHISTKTKKSKEEVDRLNDIKFIKDEIAVTIDAKTELPTLAQLERLWILSARVLRNIEYAEHDIAFDAYTYILKSAITFCIMYCIVNLLSINEEYGNEENKEYDDDTKLSILMSLHFIPLSCEMMLLDFMGSKKLIEILDSKIKSDIDDLTVSDFECYLSVFLYTDLEGAKSYEYLKKYLTKISKYYIQDSSFLKLSTFFHESEDNSAREKQYLKLLLDIYKQSKLKYSRTPSKYQMNKMLSSEKNRLINLKRRQS